MVETRAVEIDFEVHQRIELERRSFAEPDNLVLRRLLGINEDESRSELYAQFLSNGRPWSGKGVLLPHATLLRMEYNGKQHVGQIENGEWVVEEKRFRSPSAAASGVALTKLGKHPSLDGWKYWEAKKPGENSWTPIDVLRGHPR